MIYFLDTSALLKYYVEEKGSIRIKTLRRNDFAVGMIIYPEFASALARRVKKGLLSTEDRHGIMQSFDYDMENRYWVIPIDKILCQHAAQLVEKYYLRGYDSVQLACALRVNGWLLHAGSQTGLTFLSADQDLFKAAASEGLATENPEDH